MAEKRYFIWLGSGRARKQGVLANGVLLDQAARANLPVPSGGILLDAFHEGAVADGLLVMANGRITCPDPSRLHQAVYNDIRFPKLDKAVRVQPLFAACAIEPISFTDPAQLAHSLCEAYSAEADDERRDVVVMASVVRDVEGTAVTSTSQTTDSINYNGQTLTLPQTGLFQPGDGSQPASIQRLQKLLRGVRRTFIKGAWTIEWADDGTVCWLVGMATAV